jgi:hypothetical protein
VDRTCSGVGAGTLEGGAGDHGEHKAGALQ